MRWGAASAGCLETATDFVRAGPAPPCLFEEVTEGRGFDYQTTGAGFANTSAGVYVTDFNDTGWEDVLLVGGEEPVLFENVGGEFRPSDALPDVSQHLEDDDRVHRALFVDFDNDGWEELLLFPGGGQILADYSDPVEEEVKETDSRAIVLQNDGGGVQRGSYP